MYLIINWNYLHNFPPKLRGCRISGILLKRVYFNPITKCEGSQLVKLNLWIFTKIHMSSLPQNIGALRGIFSSLSLYQMNLLIAITIIRREMFSRADI